MKNSLTMQNSSILNSAIKIVLGIVLLFLCTQIQLPIGLIPITLQSAGILIIALTYNKKDALSSVAGYITVGGLGLPVFTNFTSGIVAFTGPTGGYIIGFLFCTYIITTCREKFGEDKFWKLFLYSIIGSGVIFVPGIVHLSNFIGFDKAIEVGLIPFIIPGIIKALFVAASVKLIKASNT